MHTTLKISKNSESMNRKKLNAPAINQSKKKTQHKGSAYSFVR